MNTPHLEASGQSNWLERTIGQTSLLLLPDATSSSTSQRFYYLPKHPTLVRDAANRPVFSLTLILSRQLSPTDETIYPLIQRGILSFEVALTLPESAIAQLQTTTSAEFLSLFARDATFNLMHDLTPLTTATATGANVKAALSVNLERSTTLEVLAALDRTPQAQGAQQIPPPPVTTEAIEAELRLTTEIAYRVTTADRTIHFSGSWATIHDCLHKQSPAGTFTLTEIELQFEQLLKSELITVSEVNASGKLQKLANPQSAELFGVFLRVATVILRRETPELEPSDRANQYSLRSRPHPMFTLDYRQKLTGAQMQTITLTTDLDTLFGGCLDQLDRAQFIHLVVPSSGSGNGGFVPAPHRIQFDRARSDRNLNTQLQLAAISGSVQSMALALKPDTTNAISTHALINSDVIRVNQAAQLNQQLNKQWLVDDEVMIIDRTKGSGSKSLPVINNPSASLWCDPVTGSGCSYIPSFELVQPAANQDPSSSPFLFSFERIGASASQNLLSGTLRFQLRRSISAATQAALMQAGARATAVPRNHLSVTLQLPFIDQKDNQLKHQSLLGQVEENGDLLTVTVSLADDWVRLCYGALAYPNFQREPAFLNLSYSFHAYVPLYPEEVYLAYGGKAALTPVVYSAGETVDRSQPFFNAAEATYYTPSSKVTLQPEPRLLSTEIPVATKERQLVLQAALSNRPNSDTVIRPIKPDGLQPEITKPIKPIPSKPFVVIKPDLNQTIDLIKTIQRQQYAVQRQVHQERWQVLFPCSTFGELYREKISNSTTAIGCRDALKLGQTRFAQYEELPELAQEWFRVYRSLQQPGRFLVVPKRYRITRYAPSVPERAYRPVILAYYTIDLVNPANNRVTFHASLEPDIPLYARRELFTRLSSFASKPVIEYPTELASETQYAWSIDSRIQADLSAVKEPDLFRIALSIPPVQTPTMTAILQTSGIYGNVQFKLPDDSVLQSALVMELSNVTGPWSTGAISVTISGNKAILTNKIESELVVSDLLVYGSGQRLPVEKNLKSGASLQVDLPTNITEAYAVYTIQPGSATAPEEIRRFAEDIKTNVIFASQINFANHGLQRLDVQAQIEGLAGTYSVPLSGDPPVGQVELLLPLTTFLSRKVLQFNVTKTFTNGQIATTNWINWDLETQGNFVSLQWSMIQ